MVRIGTPTTWSLADLHRQLEARLEPWFPEWGDRGPLWPSDGETVRTGTPTAGSLADRTAGLTWTPSAYRPSGSCSGSAAWPGAGAPVLHDIGRAGSAARASS